MTTLDTMPYRIELPKRRREVPVKDRPRAWLAPFLLGLSATVVLGFVIMEALGLRYVQAHSCPDMLKIRFFETEVRDPGVVYLGNSQMHYGVMPRIAAEMTGEAQLEGYNLALLGAPLDLCFILARDVLHGPRKPRVLVLGVMPLSLESGGRKEPELLFRYGSLADIAHAIESGELPPTALVSSAFRGVETLMQLPFQQLKKPIRAYRADHLRAGLGGWWAEADIPLCAPVPPDKWQVMLSKLAEPQSLYFTDDNRSTRQLLAIRDLAQRRGIRLVLVLPPLHADARKRFYQPGSEERYREWMAAFCRKERLVYWDLEEPDRYVLEDFADPVHLNAAGAAKFSRRLGERLAGFLSEVCPVADSAQSATVPAQVQ